MPSWRLALSGQARPWDSGWATKGRRNNDVGDVDCGPDAAVGALLHGVQQRSPVREPAVVSMKRTNSSASTQVPEAYMQLGIIGTGNVAQTLARSWAAVGHQTTFGSRDPAAKSGLDAPVRSLADTVAGSDVVVNATLGSASLDVVTGIGPAAFAGKVLVDVANANTPSFELVYPNSSLAEKLQEALPEAKVVKTMNTAAMLVMTEPGLLDPSSVFLSGDDAGAKATVTTLLTDLGWGDGSIIDLGGIRSARGPEHFFLMFAALAQSLGSPKFNIRVIR
jgi:predicted dinucleotide-binding enzyme